MKNSKTTKKNESPIKKAIKKVRLYRLDYDALSNGELKKERAKMRRALKRFINAITGKDRTKEEIKKSIAEFKHFYKETYTLNDLSLASLTNSSDEDDRRDIQSMLDIIKG